MKKYGLKIFILFNIVFFIYINNIYSKDNLVIVSDGFNLDDSIDINPLFFSKDRILKELLYTPLIRIDKNWNYICDMCESFPSYEIKKDKKKIRTITHWKLKDFYWGDGSKIKSSDIKLSWEILKAMYSEFELYHPIEYIESINIIDDKTFDIVFLGTNYDFYKIQDFFIVPSLEQKIWEESLKKVSIYRKKSLYNTDRYNPGLYNGGFYLKNNNTLLINKNNKDNYKDSIFMQYSSISLKKINIKELNYYSKNESFDIFYPSEINSDYYRDLDSNKYYLLKNETSICEEIVFNLQVPTLLKKELREALIKSIDVGRIANLVGKKTIYNFLNPKDPNYYKYHTKYKQDKMGAGIILDSLGWKYDTNNKDNVYRTNLEGQYLEIEVSYLKTDIREKISKYIQEDLNSIGVKVELNPVNLSNYKRMVSRSSFKGLLLIAWDIPKDNVPKGLLYSREIPSFENDYTGQNILGLRSGNIDKFIEDYYKEENKDKKRLIYASIVQELSLENTYVPLFFIDEVFYINKKLHLDYLYPSIW